MSNDSNTQSQSHDIESKRYATDDKLDRAIKRILNDRSPVSHIAITDSNNAHDIDDDNDLRATLNAIDDHDYKAPINLESWTIQKSNAILKTKKVRHLRIRGIRK